MSLSPFHCGHCGALAYQKSSAVNRARRAGFSLYCNRRCAGLGRRSSKSKAQKVAEKAEYDRAYRKENRAALKVKKAAYFQRTYDPASAAIWRKQRSAQHAEYCRRPEYRIKKREYDLDRRAQEFGEFADSYKLLSGIEAEISERATRYEIMLANGTLNKSQQRRREYDKSYGG
ncbi:MAG: hypothetical protein JO107_16270 [Hyphomicrobiales bacterium]|nr:hypothetical protein [Hyphomicrobiales bacterium]